MRRLGFLALPVLVLLAQVAFAKTVICHVPPGNPANARTLGVADAAVRAHLAHGDCLGPCPCEHCPADPAKTEPGICGCGFTEGLFNANDVGCTFCLLSAPPPELACQFFCLAPPTCFCGGEPGCCDQNPCCDDCPGPKPPECDVNTCGCDPEECCFTACP